MSYLKSLEDRITTLEKGQEIINNTIPIYTFNINVVDDCTSSEELFKQIINGLKKVGR